MQRNRSRLQLLLIVALFLVGVLACSLGGSKPTDAPPEADTDAPVSEAADESAVEATEAPVLEATGVPASEPTDTPVPTDTPTPEVADLEVLDTTLALGVDEDGQAVDEVKEFTPEQAVYVVMTLKGRPTGIMTGQFYRGDTLLGEANLDLKDIEDAPLLAIGGETYVHFSWTPDPDTVTLISDNYRVEAFYDDEPVGSYPFSVVPPADAIPSQIQEVVLARGVDDDYNAVDPTTSFTPDDVVYLLMRGDFGLHTWLGTEWYVNGQLDEESGGSLTLTEDGSDKSIYFYFAPEGGWPVGEHQVALTMNDEEVGRYDFTVEEAPASSLVPFEDPNGVFEMNYPVYFDQFEESATEDGYGYMFLASDASGAIHVFFSGLEMTLSEEQWGAFVEDYTIAGMPGFGEDTVELERLVGDPGVHVILLEVESEESGLHGLVWVEEAEGAMAVVTLATPIERWTEQEEMLFEVLDSFTWSTDAVSAIAPPPEPTPAPAVPTPTPQPPPSSEWWPGQPEVAPGMACFLVVSKIDGEVTFNLGPQTQKIPPNGHVWFVIEPGHTTWTGDLPDGRRGGGELDIQPGCEPFVNVLPISG